MEPVESGICEEGIYDPHFPNSKDFSKIKRYEFTH